MGEGGGVMSSGGRGSCLWWGMRGGRGVCGVWGPPNGEHRVPHDGQTRAMVRETRHGVLAM